jgi:cytochrome P450
MDALAAMDERKIFSPALCLRSSPTALGCARPPPYTLKLSRDRPNIADQDRAEAPVGIASVSPYHGCRKSKQLHLRIGVIPRSRTMISPMGSGKTGLALDEPPVLHLHRSLPRAMQIYHQDRLGWMEKAAERAPVAGLKLGPITSLVISDAEAARSVLITGASSWKRPLNMTTPIRLAVGENPLTLSDKAWSKLEPFLAPDFRKRVIEPRVADIKDLVADEVNSLPLGTTLDFDQVLGRVAMTVAAWVLFGEHLGRDRADELVAHQRVLIEWVGERVGKARSVVPLAPGRSSRTMRGHRDALRAYADALMARRKREGHSQGDVLDALMRATPRGRALRDRQLRSHLLGLLGAGNETTAAALGWAVVHGAAHVPEWAALRSDPSLCPAYVAETLRLSPPAWVFTRVPTRAGASVSLGELRFPVSRFGAVALNIWGLGRDPKVWPDPISFWPARQQQLTKEQGQAMLPFSLGPRSCIGQHLAMAEMLTVLPALARRGDVVVEGPIVPHAIFTLRVRGGLRGRFTEPTQTSTVVTRKASNRRRVTSPITMPIRRSGA